MNADYIAALCYFLTMILGVTARLRRTSFGRWHHAMFALSFVSAGVAIVIDPIIAQIIPASALLILPFTRPRTSQIHDFVAVMGAIGWIVVIA